MVLVRDKSAFKLKVNINIYQQNEDVNQNSGFFDFKQKYTKRCFSFKNIK